MKIRSGPGLPHVGAVAYGGLPAVADDGGPQEPGLLQELFQLELGELWDDIVDSDDADDGVKVDI